MVLHGKLPTKEKLYFLVKEKNHFFATKTDTL